MNCTYLRIWKLNTGSLCPANELKFYLVFSKDIHKCTVQPASFLNSTVQTTCSPTGLLWQKASPFQSDMVYLSSKVQCSGQRHW